MTERPWIDCERTAAMPSTPLIASSIGLVTSTSTCSGESPGASVWIETCGGANSGKTSRRRVRDDARAVDHQREREADDDAAMADRAADEPGQHARTGGLTRPTRRPRSPGRGTPRTAAPRRRARRPCRPARAARPAIQPPRRRTVGAARARARTGPARAPIRPGEALPLHDGGVGHQRLRRCRCPRAGRGTSATTGVPGVAPGQVALGAVEIGRAAG